MHLNLHLHLHSALSGRSPVVSIRPTSLSSSSSVSSGRSSTVISAAYRFHLFQPSFVVIWPSFSGSVQPVWPFRLLSGYSGRFGRISAISAAVRPLRFRALLRPLRLYFGHLLCRRLSRFGHRRLSGCLLPPVVPLRLSGPCLLFGHSPAADCSWPSVGPAIGLFVFFFGSRRLVAPTPAAVQPLRPLDAWPFRLFRHCSAATTFGLSSKSFSSLFNGSIVVDGFVACRFPHSSRCQAAFRQYVRR